MESTGMRSEETRKTALDYFGNPVSANRLMGEYSSGEHGPALIVIGGIHGNEPGGIEAFQRVYRKLDRQQLPIKGRLVGLRGNMAALRQGTRLIDRDLNRVCTLENEQRYVAGKTPAFQEEQAFFALLQEFEKVQQKTTELLFMDLHTTSSSSQPYISVNRRKESFSFAEKFPLFVVKGIEDYIPGHIDHYLNLKGHKGCTVEGGQHHAQDSIDNHEAAIWLALVNAGLIGRDEMGDFGQYCQKLIRSTAGEPLSLEVIYRYAISEDEVFAMKPGYVNFQKIRKGEILAESDERNIVSEWDARIFMPLYQAEGKDGFFVVREEGSCDG